MAKKILTDIENLLKPNDIFDIEVGDWSKNNSEYNLIVLSDMKKLLKIRKHDDYIPIIFLAEEFNKEEAIFFYKNGGDDYQVKSIDKDILFIKIRLLIRHEEEKESILIAPEYKIGKYLVDTKNKMLYYDGEVVKKLRKKSVRLLTLFAKNINKPVSLEQVQEYLWEGEKYNHDRIFSLRMHIMHVKQLLNKDRRVFIVNIYEDGYKLIVRRD